LHWLLAQAAYLLGFADALPSRLQALVHGEPATSLQKICNHRGLTPRPDHVLVGRIALLRGDFATLGGATASPTFPCRSTANVTAYPRKLLFNGVSLHQCSVSYESFRLIAQRNKLNESHRCEARAFSRPATSLGSPA
jgi:hypothetical protein